MAKQTPEERIAALEQQVKSLREWRTNKECDAHLLNIGQRITNRLFELGPDKVDLKLIAKLNTALGVDVMPLTGKGAREWNKYTKHKIKTAKTRKA